MQLSTKDQDSDLYEVFMLNLAPVVRWVQNTIHWINLYPVDSAKRFSDLSVGQRYPPCE